MKSIYKYLLAGTVLFGAASCEDQLDLAPFNSIAANEALQSPADFTNAIRGTYSGLRGVGYWGGSMFITPDVLADNLIINTTGRLTQQTLHLWRYDANSTWGALWSSGYSVAYRSNFILENLETLPEGPFRNNIEGEARALRAMAHFDIARVYSESPAQASSGDLGVPYMTSTDVRQKPSRPALAETYTQIVNDLLAARDLIAETNPAGRLNKAAVNGLLSRVYLFMGNNQGTIDAATAAIQQFTGAVATQTQFPQVWTDQSKAGLMFYIPILDVDALTLGVEYSQTTNGVRSEYVVDYAFYQQFQDTDVRKSAYITTSVFSGRNQNHVKKYSSRPGSALNIVDLKILRIEEVYLNRAEAYANLGGKDAEALADLNMIRSNRYTGFMSADETGQALKDAIALERRLELAFEGDRFFTLKRKGLPVTRSDFGDESNGGGTALPADARTLAADSYKFVLPIPQAEMNANENIRGQQNPGYTN